ncbi:unnamed protein product, partial [Prorocentrum cordatum]
KTSFSIDDAHPTLYSSKNQWVATEAVGVGPCACRAAASAGHVRPGRAARGGGVGVGGRRAGRAGPHAAGLPLAPRRGRHDGGRARLADGGLLVPAPGGAAPWLPPAGGGPAGARELGAGRGRAGGPARDGVGHQVADAPAGHLRPGVRPDGAQPRRRRGAPGGQAGAHGAGLLLGATRRRTTAGSAGSPGRWPGRRRRRCGCWRGCGTSTPRRAMGEQRGPAGRFAGALRAPPVRLPGEVVRLRRAAGHVPVHRQGAVPVRRALGQVPRRHLGLPAAPPRRQVHRDQRRGPLHAGREAAGERRRPAQPPWGRHAGSLASWRRRGPAGAPGGRGDPQGGRRVRRGPRLPGARGRGRRGGRGRRAAGAGRRPGRRGGDQARLWVQPASGRGSRHGRRAGGHDTRGGRGLLRDAPALLRQRPLRPPLEPGDLALVPAGTRRALRRGEAGGAARALRLLPGRPLRAGKAQEFDGAEAGDGQAAATAEDAASRRPALMRPASFEAEVPAEGSEQGFQAVVHRAAERPCVVVPRGDGEVVIEYVELTPEVPALHFEAQAEDWLVLLLEGDSLMVNGSAMRAGELCLLPRGGDKELRLPENHQGRWRSWRGAR